MSVVQEFDMWRDYLQLAGIVAAIIEERRNEWEQQHIRSVDTSPGPSSAISSPDLLLAWGSGDACSSSNSSNSTTEHSSGHSSDDGQVYVQGNSGSLRSSSPGTPHFACNFCKHNGESKNVYMSHSLKRGNGTILCPVLRKYVCPLCGATGDRAHTLKYCALNPQKQSLYQKIVRNSAGRQKRQ